MGTESRTESVQDSNSGFSFQENEVKDRSVDKEEIKTMRRGGMGGGGRGNMMNQGQGQTHPQRGGGGRDNRVGGGIDPDVLAKEIDELLADTDSDDDSDSDIDLSTTESDSDSDSDSEDTNK